MQAEQPLAPEGALLIDRAKQLASGFKERADEARRKRTLPSENIAAMQEAGFFRSLQPKRWGGYEIHPNDFFAIHRIIGAACPASGWVLSVVGVHNWQLALFPLEAQEDVWAADPRTLIASSYMPVGKVQKVDGGFSLSGTWGFSSGIDHCQWVFLGGFVPTSGPRRDMRTFLVPKKDLEVIDDWQVHGLEGSGSKTIKVTDKFIPFHRTHKFSDGFRQDSPGNEYNNAPLYRIPFGQLFISAVAANGLSILQGAIDTFKVSQKNRIARSTHAKVAERPSAQQSIADAAATLHALTLVQKDQFSSIMEALETQKPLQMEDRVRWKSEASRICRQAKAAIGGLVEASGGSAVFTKEPIGSYFRDILAAGGHYANDPYDAASNYGRVLMGGENQDYFV